MLQYLHLYLQKVFEQYSPEVCKLGYFIFPRLEILHCTYIHTTSARPEVFKVSADTFR